MTASRAPAVSVVMIFLDAAAFIEEAIASVLAQTDTDWELILVDDGSTDTGTAIARRHAARDPARVRYVTHPGHRNRGMSASRNLGLRRARGDFVAFLDADDVWLPERLAEHLAILRADPRLGMVYGPTLYWYNWPGAPRPPAQRPVRADRAGELALPPGRSVAPPAALIVFLETHGGALPGICSLLARRAAVAAVGGFEEGFRGLYEDQVFLSKMCLHVPVYVHDRVLDKYRQHAGSHCALAMATGDYHPSAPHPGRERYLRWLEGYLREQDVPEGRLTRALTAELWPYRHPWLDAARRYALARNPAYRLARRIARTSLPRRAHGWLRRRIKGAGGQPAAGRSS